MHKRADACVARRFGDGSDRLDMDGVEALPAALIEDAGQVDGRVGALERLPDLVAVTDIAAHQLDLSDTSHGRQEIGARRPAHRHADAIAGLGQRAHDIAAQKPEPPKTVTTGLTMMTDLPDEPAVHSAAGARRKSELCRRPHVA